MGGCRILSGTGNVHKVINKDSSMRQNVFLFIAFAFLESA